MLWSLDVIRQVADEGHPNCQPGRCGEQLLVLCRFFELPSPKVIQDCAPTASEIFGILDNMAKSLEGVIFAVNAREDEAASKKRTPRRS